MFLPAFTTHVCLGAPYGWSAISHRLSLEVGMVSPASSDWSLDQVTWPMSIQIACGGISAALLANWTGRVGVRRAMLTGSLLFGGGMMVSSQGVLQHNIHLLYLGSVLGGLGYGCAYTPPLQALMDWYPDKRGLASGLVIAGFGSGGLMFTPVINTLSGVLRVLPRPAGPSDLSHTVVFCTPADLARLPYSLEPGHYVAGSGSSGLGSSLAIMSCLYTLLILGSALTISRPPPGYSVPGYVPPTTSLSSQANVPVENVLRTPQFWLLFSTATLLATGGMSLMSVASPMVQDVFTSALPTIVTPAWAAGYVMSLSVANLSGRVFWAGISDRIGRRQTFNILCLSSIPLYLALPHLITSSVSDPSSPAASLYLTAFCVSSFLAVSIMGGVFSVLPPYEADLYGSKYVGAIHGKFLPFSTIRGIAGPALLLHLRSVEEAKSIEEILRNVDPKLFMSTFNGADISEAAMLVENKTVTLSKLVSILPAHMSDPTPFLYNSTMYSMAALAACSALLHASVKPVERKYFEK